MKQLFETHYSISFNLTLTHKERERERENEKCRQTETPTYAPTHAHTHTTHTHIHTHTYIYIYIYIHIFICMWLRICEYARRTDIQFSSRNCPSSYSKEWGLVVIKRTVTHRYGQELLGMRHTEGQNGLRPASRQRTIDQQDEWEGLAAAVKWGAQQKVFWALLLSAILFVQLAVQDFLSMEGSRLVTCHASGPAIG